MVASKKVYTAKKESDLPQVAREFIKHIEKPAVVLFYGEMGVGKTTFIRSLCSQLGIKERVSSPTFSLVNEYQTDGGQSIYHFDFYRIETPEEALDMGVEEYFYSGNYCFVEWPDKINDYLPENAVVVEIIEDKGMREIVVLR